jgi:uncharacterized membrane protein
MAKQTQNPGKPSEGAIVRGASLAAKRGPNGEMGILATAYSGPLPPPELIERYDAIVPGMGSRLLSDFEAEQRHRRDWEISVLQSRNDTTQRESDRIARGQLFGLIIGLVLVLCGAAVAITGIVYDSKTGIWFGSLLSGGMTLAIITSFLANKPKQVVPPKLTK